MLVYKRKYHKSIIVILNHLAATGGGRFRLLISDFLNHCLSEQSAVCRRLSAISQNPKNRLLSLDFKPSAVLSYHTPININSTSSVSSHSGDTIQNICLHFLSTIRTAKNLMLKQHLRFSHRNFITENIFVKYNLSNIIHLLT